MLGPLYEYLVNSLPNCEINTGSTKLYINVDLGYSKGVYIDIVINGYDIDIAAKYVMIDQSTMFTYQLKVPLADPNYKKSVLHAVIKLLG